MIKSAGYDPHCRFAAALIASAIKAARKIEQPDNHEAHVSALRAIEWLARPGVADQWFDMAGFDYEALVERLPLSRWVKRGRELVTTNGQLKRAVS